MHPSTFSVIRTNWIFSVVLNSRYSVCDFIVPQGALLSPGFLRAKVLAHERRFVHFKIGSDTMLFAATPILKVVTE